MGDDMDHDADVSGIRGSTGGDGGGGGGGSRRGGRSKADTRRGVDLPPSGTEVRAFVNLFEDIAVNPPQDAVLRQHWDTWVKEDVGKHNTQQNRQVGRCVVRCGLMGGTCGAFVRVGAVAVVVWCGGCWFVLKYERGFVFIESWWRWS